MKPHSERRIYVAIALLVALVIYFFNIQLIPDFDIGFNGAWILLTCLAMTLVLSVTAILLICKFAPAEKINRGAVYAVIAFYWLAEWGFCYWKCVLEATRLWNQLMYGPV